jgi:peptidoglycan hydrolase-like protein with peptidoglycan-binding domain
MVESKDYIPKISGLSRSAKGDDVVRLQTYLAKFGYIKSPIVERFGMQEVMPSLPSVEEGIFDEGTEQALKVFQEFNHLPVTGMLDEDTRDLMETPRCGFPDLDEFAIEGRKWKKTNLTYCFKNFTPDIPRAQIEQAIAKAFSLWSEVTPLTFKQIQPTDNADIVIRFVKGDHGDGSSFDGPNGVLAHAYYPPPNGGDIAGDAHFDDDENWTVTIPPTSGTFDLVSVAAHEFGHSLGLAHSTITDSLMYAFYSGPHRFLNSDDISGIQSIYGRR